MEHFTNLHLKLTTVSNDIEYIIYIDTVSELAQTNFTVAVRAVVVDKVLFFDFF